MKACIALFVLIAGVSALPHEQNEVEVRDLRFVTDAIASAVEDVSQSIKDSGLDPFYIKRETFTYALPVPVIFNAAAYVEEVFSTGLSNIVINQIDFSILTTRLTFDIELPLINAAGDAVTGTATVFGNTLTAQVSGGLAIQRIRVRGNVRVNVGIISGITVRSININFTLGGIISNLDLVIEGTEYSSIVNTFLGTTIPATIKAFEPEINELLEIVLRDVIEENL